MAAPAADPAGTSGSPTVEFNEVLGEFITGFTYGLYEVPADPHPAWLVGAVLSEFTTYGDIRDLLNEIEHGNTLTIALALAAIVIPVLGIMPPGAARNLDEVLAKYDEALEGQDEIAFARLSDNLSKQPIRRTAIGGLTSLTRYRSSR